MSKAFLTSAILSALAINSAVPMARADIFQDAERAAAQKQVKKPVKKTPAKPTQKPAQKPIEKPVKKPVVQKPRVEQNTESEVTPVKPKPVAKKKILQLPNIFGGSNETPKNDTTYFPPKPEGEKSPPLNLEEIDSGPNLNATPTQEAPAEDIYEVTTNRTHLEVLAAVDAGSIRQALDSSWSFGLNPTDYPNSDLETLLQALTDLSTGTTDPATLANDIKFKKKKFMSPDALAKLVTDSGGDAAVLMEMTAPNSAQFRGLRQAMLRLHEVMEKGGWEPLQAYDKDLVFGASHPVILQIKQRVKILGYPISSEDEFYDEQLEKAIADIQANLKGTPDKVISVEGRTQKFFALSVKQLVQQIQADMEKLRWLPRELETRHIFVNTAFSSFLLMDRGLNKMMNFRTVNGRPDRKTPTMKDKITYLVLNPTWTVPPTVFFEDKLTLIRSKSPSEIQTYFNKNKFEIYNSDFTQRKDPLDIDWNSVDPTTVDFYIRQRPNYLNALGVVKFMMTNPYAIYLHDTNDRLLFQQPQRLMSSGCIRLERPLDLAEYLLKGTEWDRDSLNNYVSTPYTQANNQTKVSLKSPISVYIMPLTSTYSSDKVIRFTTDVYGHNEILLKRLHRLGE